VFWSTGELRVYNIEYQFPKFAPWFVAVGSNGGGEAIGYLRAKPSKVCLPFALSRWINLLQCQTTSSSC
jgi:hypothetical protein